MKRICQRVAFVGLLLAGSVATNAQPVFPASEAGATDGFVAIFDGQTLADWDADPRYWQVENGALVGIVTPETLLQANSFAIWRGGTPAEFELKVEYRISAAGNSGINYRSVQMPSLAFALRGYQADIDGANLWSGQNYEERGRAFLALRGQMTRVVPGGTPVIIGTVGDKETLASFVRAGDWNQVHLIVRGNVLIHLVNGHVMSVVVDEDSANRTAAGLIGVQVHVGPPMKVEFRNFLLKALPVIDPARTTFGSKTP